MDSASKTALFNSSHGRITRSVAVVAPIGALDHQPGILNAIHSFADAGYDVDLFVLRNYRYPEARFPQTSVRVRYLPITFSSKRESRWLATLLFSIWLPWVLRPRYSIIFAGGIRALISTWIASFFRPLRIVNLQLELYVGSKLNTRAARLFKWIERKAIRASWLSLIHDEKRAQMLSEDAGIPRNQIEILPNSPRGVGRVNRSGFLHERLRIPKGQKLIVCPGTLGSAFQSEEIVAASQELPSGWTCVIHSAQPRTFDDPYVRRLAHANTAGRVVFSLEPVDYCRVDDVISSAAIGLALYGSSGGPNTTEVGLASGKLCHFLQQGVPVIVSDFPVLREFVKIHRVGLPVKDASDISQAVAAISADYEGYARRAAECFTRELSFEAHFRRVLERIS
jgi:hypothetical protein